VCICDGEFFCCAVSNGCVAVELHWRSVVRRPRPNGDAMRPHPCSILYKTYTGLLTVTKRFSQPPPSHPSRALFRLFWFNCADIEEVYLSTCFLALGLPGDRQQQR
jgi:hypothetical protein